MPARPSLLAAWQRPYWVGKTSWKRYVLGRTGHLRLEQARWKSGPRRSPKDFVGSSVWVPNDLRCELPAPAIQTFHGLPVRGRSVKTDETSALRDFLYGLSRNRPRSPTSPRPVGVTSWSPLLIFKTPKPSLLGSLQTFQPRPGEASGDGNGSATPVCSCSSCRSRGGPSSGRIWLPSLMSKPDGSTCLASLGKLS